MALLLLLIFFVQQSAANSGSFPEHEVKAAFLFNFMRFTDWPPEKISKDKTMKVFVIGNYTECKTLRELDKKKINDREINIHIFKSYKSIQDPNILQISHLLFISSPESKHSKEILNITNGKSVLVIGESNGFLEIGGIVNFVKKKQKIRFEVNRVKATKENLVIDSKLLKLATRVIVEE